MVCWMCPLKLICGIIKALWEKSPSYFYSLPDWEFPPKYIPLRKRASWWGTNSFLWDFSHRVQWHGGENHIRDTDAHLPHSHYMRSKVKCYDSLPPPLQVPSAYIFNSFIYFRMLKWFSKSNLITHFLKRIPISYNNDSSQGKQALWGFPSLSRSLH